MLREYTINELNLALLSSTYSFYNKLYFILNSIFISKIKYLPYLFDIFLKDKDFDNYNHSTIIRKFIVNNFPSDVVNYGKKQCVLTSLKAVVLIINIWEVYLDTIFLPFLIIKTTFPLYKLVCFCSQMLP